MKPEHAEPVREKEIVGLEDPEVHQRFEESRRRLQEQTKPLIDAVRASERLSQKDLAIRINTRI